MANVLIVSGSYFPYASANAVCMKEFERAMVARGDRVVYAIRKHDIDTPDVTCDGDIKIYHVARTVDLFFAACEKLKNLALPQPIKALFRLSLLGIKAVSKVYAKLRFGSLRGLAETAYLDKYAAAIAKIVEEEAIDTIISVSMPFLSHKAVLRYLDTKSARTVKWVAYMIDAYSQKYGVDDPTAVKEELDVMRRADRVVFLSVLKDSYSGAPFNEYASKFAFVPLPLLDFFSEEGENDMPLFDKEKTNFVYAGTLYDDTSSLDFFAKFLRAVDCDSFRFHFMGKLYPRNKAILEELAQECKAEIHIYGVQPFEVAQRAVEDADIVLNFGNLSPNQIPSKIYKHIVKKKPLLTFYKIDNDPSLPLLQKYPLALNIKESEASKTEDVQRFVDFVADAPQKSVSAEELISLYHGETTEDVCTLFLESIEE